MQQFPDSRFQITQRSGLGISASRPGGFQDSNTKDSAIWYAFCCYFYPTLRLRVRNNVWTKIGVMERFLINDG